MSIAQPPYTSTATFTLEHYEHMVERGAFGYEYEPKKVELRRGRIVDKGADTPAKFTLDHYEHMIAVGAFDAPYNIPVELLHGEIVMMSPIGPSHSNDIDFLAKWSFQATAGHPIRVRIQNPIRLPSDNSEPEPDVCWVREQDYSQQHPNPEDVLLLVEVAESSLTMDQGPKLKAYAEAGVADYWIVNLVDKQIEVYRQPLKDKYQQKQVVRGGETIAPLALPTAQLAPSRLFGAK